MAYSPFKFSSSMGGSSLNLSTPKYAPLQIPKIKKQDHSVLHNLLTDIRDAAVGIPMGFVKLGKSGYSAATGNPAPLEHMLSEVYHSYGHLYGPAFHGHWGETAHRLGQHPLQPLLDAVSIATLPAGGLGAAVKAGDTVAQLGARAGVIAADRAASIEKFALHFRPSSRSIEVLMGQPAVSKSYSGNRMIRRSQLSVEAGANLLAQAMPKAFGSDNPKFRDLSDTGRQGRTLEHIRSEREHAATATTQRVMVAARNIFKKDSSLTADDIANILAPHISEIAIAHALPVPPHLLTKGKGRAGLGEGWLYLHKKGRFLAYPTSKDPQAFGLWLKNFGERLTTDKKSSALQDKHGNYLVVRTKTMQEMGKQGASTFAALHALYNTPTKVWKWMVLATAPRYFVNNVVGNGLMYAMAANPVDTTRGMYHTIRDSFDNRTATRALNEVEKAQRGIIGDWVSKWYSAATEGFGHEVARNMKLHERFKNQKVADTVQKLETGLFGVTHSASDAIPRRMAINYLIKRQPEYQKEFRAQRMAGENARSAHVRAADKASQDTAVRSRVTQGVNDILGQYHYFTNTGNFAKTIVPFYSWDRAIMRHAWVMASERPVEAQTLAQLGQQGTAETQDLLGKIPDFLKGVIPLSALGVKGGGNGVLGLLFGGDHGRTKVLSTQGINPYSTIPDVAEFTATLFHGNPRAGEELATQANPILTGLIEHYTGQSLLSGKKLQSSGGVIQDTFKKVAETTPYVKLAETAIHGRPHPKVDSRTGKPRAPLLYRGDTHQQLTSLFGVPIKEANLATAGQLYRNEHGITLPKQKKYKPATFKKSKSFKRTIRRTTKRHKPSLSHPRLGTHIPRAKKVKFIKF